MGNIQLKFLGIIALKLTPANFFASMDSLCAIPITHITLPLYCICYLLTLPYPLFWVHQEGMEM